MIEIVTVEDFKTYKSKEGYFIITDTTGRKLHATRCTFVDLKHFSEKVADNANRNGKYFYTDDFFEAREYPKVKKCEACRRYL
ncbi:hypothetical protein [Paenibacillus sacheonensis]|uniref:Uncharacterized protein n=1 Tax=Paenibacillus sacheonensis TaxID=742054 RepID=A0A7X5C1G1_9BACL|nr:hypothetical protein [Paenibacillus sacheonensis]MBM7564982.1 hypothetical protein [Paenibacillus sacheonensis]NBC70230.1 hypothetical protein [Paenibacillus sacheonensis]